MVKLSLILGYSTSFFAFDFIAQRSIRRPILSAMNCKTMSCSDYGNGLVSKIGPSPRAFGEGPPSGFDNFGHGL
ncbi:hypothetical protein OUZ56_009645 [Daphnia magna]|uniref:Uncharacterized protein n=1 Tax=Daphnia magna TaxID=35525 RepID=A0ABR0AGK0_9CRUS|nr:hypothetical protein OUZ56_009645 [Daphnia magna]